MSLTAAEIAFLAAREAIARGARERYQKANPTSDFRTVNLLGNPALRNLAHEVLVSSRGPLIDDQHRFPATLWCYGATDTYNGRPFLGGVADFVRVLEGRARAFAAKREGWVIEPTTNTDGRRINASTTAMHAVFLDCDGNGEWHQLLTKLEQLHLCFIAYQSGGWSPTTPKWRILFPLAEPFDVSNDTKQQAWKTAYGHVRTIVGSVAELLGEGFDAATDTPCCPWFLTERRQLSDQPRQILWKTGHALDLTALILALPPLPEKQEHRTHTRSSLPSSGLTDEKLNEIIEALSAATAHVPSGRHDLYLALPGVLLDRGVTPEEVLTIIEDVSASYPRSHPDKHRLNIHNAETTIGKWESGQAVTRIGTLNERWPEIAQAVDKVLPNLSDIMANSTAFDEQTTSILPLSTSSTRRFHNPSPLVDQTRSIIRRMEKSDKQFIQNNALAIKKLISGEIITTTSPLGLDKCIYDAVKSLGRNLPITTTWVEVLDLINQSLHLMNFTQSVERIEAVAKSFYFGQDKNRQAASEKETRMEKNRRRQALEAEKCKL